MPLLPKVINAGSGWLLRVKVIFLDLPVAARDLAASIEPIWEPPMMIVPLTVDRVPDVEKLLALGEPYIKLRGSSDY